MQEQLNAMEKDILLIKNALIGTEFTDNKGALDAINQNTKFRRNAGYAAAFFTAVGTFIGGLLHVIKIKLFGA